MKTVVCRLLINIVVLFLFVPTNLYANNQEGAAGLLDLKDKIDFINSRPWRKPNYENQVDRIGYSTAAFSIPTGMEERVSFWIDIYSRFTTDQGLIHDSQYVNLVYEDVDFTDIMARDDLTDGQKRKERRKRLKEAKNNIKARLLRLSKLSSSAGLQGEDLRYWVLFQQVDEPNKFRNAMSNSRLRFQLGQRDRFLKGIFYSGRYLEEMEAIFAERGLPIELTRLPFVESSFNLLARSSVGASGIWQFMRNSARPYLKMNVSVDERNDPIKSTVAAAKLLSTNYKLLESWPLAVTGYNHGPHGVHRLVKKFQTNSLPDLVDVRKGRFGFASANFFASFLAALEVEKHADKYFGIPVWDFPNESTDIVLEKNLPISSLISWFGGDKDKAKLFNPHLAKSVWRDQVSIGTKNFIRIPTSELKVVQDDIYRIQSAPLLKGKTYKVKSGDTMSDIAQAFGVGLNTLKMANMNADPRRLRVGQMLFIPAGQ